MTPGIKTYGSVERTGKGNSHGNPPPPILFLIGKEILMLNHFWRKIFVVISIAMKIEAKRVGRLLMEFIQDEKSHKVKAMLKVCPQSYKESSKG